MGNEAAIMTVAQALAAYREEREPIVISIGRIDRAISLLDPVVGSVAAADLGPAHIKAYVETRPVQGPTLRRELSVLRAALRYAWRTRQIDRMPYVSVGARNPPRHRVLSPDELGRIRAKLKSDAVGSLLLALLLATAGRVAAVCELTWDRVDFAALSIDLRAPHDKETRRKGRAVVPISDSLLSRLAKARRANSAGSNRVLPISTATARRRLAEAAREAGVPGVTPHVIRHTVATMLLRSGVPLIVVSRLLGHKSVVTTAQEYGHLVTDDLIAASALLDPLLL